MSLEPKIQLQHPKGKKAIAMARPKYDILCSAILQHLRLGAATHTELKQAVSDTVRREKIKFEGSVEWNMEWVKLHLEACHLIQRIPGTLPQKYELVA